MHTCRAKYVFVNRKPNIYLSFNSWIFLCNTFFAVKPWSYNFLFFFFSRGLLDGNQYQSQTVICLGTDTALLSESMKEKEMKSSADSSFNHLFVGLLVQSFWGVVLWSAEDLWNVLRSLFRPIFFLSDAETLPFAAGLFLLLNFLVLPRLRQRHSYLASKEKETLPCNIACTK